MSPIPFTNKPSNTVAGPGHTAAAVAAITADSGSRDQRFHANPVIKTACPDEPEGCGALPNYRCAASRYPSGRVQQYATDFHPARYLAAGIADPRSDTAASLEPCCYPGSHDH